MNVISIDKRDKIIELGKSQQYSVDDISKMTLVSCGTIFVLLKRQCIPIISKKQANQLKMFKQIKKAYEDNGHSLSSIVSKFYRKMDLVIAFINKLNLTIDDSIVLDVFNCANPHIRFHSIKHHAISHNATQFEVNLLDYIAHRFDDSLSFMETYVRLKNKIFIRPICEHCGRPVKFINSCKLGAFQRFCCRKCANNSELTKARLREHNIEVYGVPVTSQAQCVKDKAKRHFQDKYGVDNPWQAKEVQETARQTKRSKYGDENFNNRPKCEATCLDRYGVRVSSQNVEVQRKAAISYHLVVFEKFGTEWPMQNDCVKAKFHSTMMANYNSTSYLTSNDYKKKCLELYGVENPMQCSEIRKKTTQKYSFQEISFDSSPEIAFFIYLKDHNIEFEYQPSISFEYTFNGKTHKYFPDFKVGTVLYEIKGDHFFKDGKMVCPYRDKSWSDEQYLLECSKYEAKHQCMLKNNVAILTSKDYAKYLDHVESTYGKDFLKQFKNQSTNG